MAGEILDNKGRGDAAWGWPPIHPEGRKYGVIAAAVSLVVMFGLGGVFVEILKDVWATADDIAPVDLNARLRVRLGCAHAITSAIEVADYVYKAAGTSAIFPGTPFERRFRDIHTLSQQIQSREAHFEAVGKVMFNGDPDELFL